MYRLQGFVAACCLLTLAGLFGYLATVSIAAPYNPPSRVIPGKFEEIQPFKPIPPCLGKGKDCSEPDVAPYVAPDIAPRAAQPNPFYPWGGYEKEPDRVHRVALPGTLWLVLLAVAFLVYLERKKTHAD